MTYNKGQPLRVLGIEGKNVALYAEENVYGTGTELEPQLSLRAEIPGLATNPGATEERKQLLINLYQRIEKILQEDGACDITPASNGIVLSPADKEKVGAANQLRFLPDPRGMVYGENEIPPQVKEGLNNCMNDVRQALDKALAEAGDFLDALPSNRELEIVITQLKEMQRYGWAHKEATEKAPRGMQGTLGISAPFPDDLEAKRIAEVLRYYFALHNLNMDVSRILSDQNSVMITIWSDEESYTRLCEELAKSK